MISFAAVTIEELRQAVSVAAASPMIFVAVVAMEELPRFVDVGRPAHVPRTHSQKGAVPSRRRHQRAIACPSVAGP